MKIKRREYEDLVVSLDLAKGTISAMQERIDQLTWAVRMAKRTRDEAMTMRGKQVLRAQTLQRLLDQHGIDWRPHWPPRPAS
jgi:hypothetical protein